LPLGTLITERVQRIRAAIPIRRKIMHMRSIAVILAGLIASACGTTGTGGPEADVPFVERALRLELSFGDQGLPEEFLLAEPKGLAVKDNGDILVTDEHHIKIYNAGGRPKERLGGQGQGPGEFQEILAPFIGPAGFLAVKDGFARYNLYGPDLSYLSRFSGSADEDLRDYVREQSLTFSYVTNLCPLDTTRRICALFARNRDLRGKFPVFNILVYQDGSSLRELVKHHSLAEVLNDRGGSTDSPYLGGFHWSLLSKDRLVHAQTHQGTAENGPASTYALHVLDLEGGTGTVIEVEYEPEILPDGLRELTTYRNPRINLTIEPPPVLQALLDDVRFFPAFQALRTDGDLVFLFRFNPVNERLERSILEAEMSGAEIPEGIYSRFEPYAVDIVSLSSGRLIVRAEFTCIPDVIKAGRAYRLNTRTDAFPKVECYVIDPAVYEYRRGPR
jgi:hypothetical protein